MLRSVTSWGLRGAVGAPARMSPDATGIVLPAVPLANLSGLDDPVLGLVVERALSGSRPGARTDAARVALAVEGGGMAGTVSGGMCAALEALGLIDSFDVIYGSSSGSMNASYTAAGQAQSRGGLYAIAAKQGLVDHRRMLRREPPIRTEQIATSLFQAHPHLPRVLDDTPVLRLTATSMQDKQLRVLEQFQSLDELRTAIWASCAIPFRSHDVVRFRDRENVDGGLTEPLPYRVALQEGATHVLVLRVRPVRYRKRELRGPHRKVVERLFRDAPQPVVELIGEYASRYNTQASELASGDLAGRVAQLAPDPGAGLCYWLEGNPQRLLNAVAVGAAAAYRTLVSGGVGLLLTQPAANQRVAIAWAA
jgi:predicted patatin/cPLA2 family phospholipase